MALCTQWAIKRVVRRYTASTDTLRTEIMCDNIALFVWLEWLKFAYNRKGNPMANLVFKIITKIKVEPAASQDVFLARNPEILLCPSETTCAIFIQLLQKNLIYRAISQKINCLAVSYWLRRGFNDATQKTLVSYISIIYTTRLLYTHQIQRLSEAGHRKNWAILGRSREQPWSDPQLHNHQVTDKNPFTNNIAKSSEIMKEYTAVNHMCFNKEEMECYRYLKAYAHTVFYSTCPLWLEKTSLFGWPTTIEKEKQQPKKWTHFI